MPGNVSPTDQENVRLARLRELMLLDSEPEPLFDSLARMASEVCGAPIALLSLVDRERQWFKANVGLAGVRQTPREHAFCALAITGDALLEVPDATADPRFAANPLVIGSPDIRFYAGAPLILPDGVRLGTLCVIDRRPRRLSEAQAHTLQQLAAIATQALVMRRDLMLRALSAHGQHERALAASEAHYRAIVEQQSELVSLADVDGTLCYVNAAYARHVGRTPAELIGTSLFDLVDAPDRDAVRARIDAVLRHGEQGAASENRMVAADGSVRWVAWTNGVQRDTAGRALLHSVGRDVTERKRLEQALKESEALLRRTGRMAGVGGWQLDLRSRVLTWSEQTRLIHEVAPDYVPELDHAIAFYAPEARAQIGAAVAAGIEHGQPWDLELPLVTAAGRSIWVRAIGEVESEGGQAVRLVGAFQDITERRLMQARLAESADALRRLNLEQHAMLDNEMVGIVKLRKRVAVWKNRALGRMFGYAPDELLNKPSRMLYADDESYERVGAEGYAALARGEHYRTQLQMRRKDGSLIWVDLSGVLMSPETGETMWLMNDITPLKEQQAQVERIAFHDPLTGLPNRLLLADRIGQALTLCARLRRSLALCYLDLDGFKAVNDQHGHDAGDRLLVEVAKRLQRCVRAGDTVARLGGDEFVLLLTPLGEPEECLAVIQRVIAAIREPVALGGGVRAEVSASVGVACFPTHAREAGELLRLADEAMYEAKRRGKDQIFMRRPASDERVAGHA